MCINGCDGEGTKPENDEEDVQPKDRPIVVHYGVELRSEDVKCYYYRGNRLLDELMCHLGNGNGKLKTYSEERQPKTIVSVLRDSIR